MAADKSAPESIDRTTNDQDEKPVVKRPSLTPRGSVRGRKSTSSRLSFGPGGAENENAGDDGSEIFTPKKSALSRQALERSASQRSIAPSTRSPTLPVRTKADDERPSYSKQYIAELRSATPSAPPKKSSESSPRGDGGRVPLDVVAKFGAQAEELAKSAIPSEAEIREKKERRARLAREGEYISLHGEENGDVSEEYDEDGGYEIALHRRNDSKWGETRLVREDEDVAEGFDEFVEDGKISLGNKAEIRQKQQERAKMRELIDEAQGGTGDDTDDESEAERRAAYEAAQTRAGISSQQPRKAQRQQAHPPRPTTPPIITPIPTLDECIQRLEATLREQQARRMEQVKKLEEMARRRTEVLNRRQEIQRLLDEAAVKYEALREEAGLAGRLPLTPPARASGLVSGLGSGTNTPRPGLGGATAALTLAGATSTPRPAGTPGLGGGSTTRFAFERGLENFGTLSEQMDVDGQDEGNDDSEDEGVGESGDGAGVRLDGDMDVEAAIGAQASDHEAGDNLEAHGSSDADYSVSVDTSAMKVSDNTGVSFDADNHQQYPHRFPHRHSPHHSPSHSHPNPTQDHDHPNHTHHPVIP